VTPASGSAALLRRLLPLAAVAAVIVLLVPPRTPDGGRDLERDGAASERSAAPDDGTTAPAAPPRPDGRTPPEGALGALDPRDAWRAQVARAVRPVLAERLGRAPTRAEEEKLVDALASVGPAARVLDREMLDPDDPDSIARVREQTGVLIEADRTCRALAGIGVAELLRRLDPSAVEDQGGSAADG
jgi:hypothetical protein